MAAKRSEGEVMTKDEIKERAVHFVSRMSPWLQAAELKKAEERAAELLREVAAQVYDEAARKADAKAAGYGKLSEERLSQGDVYEASADALKAFAKDIRSAKDSLAD